LQEAAKEVFMYELGLEHAGGFVPELMSPARAAVAIAAQQIYDAYFLLL
jgi:hypothetical protein